MGKRPYQAPTLRKHGSVAAVTQQNKTGTFLDFSFNAGTPITSITLS